MMRAVLAWLLAGAVYLYAALQLVTEVGRMAGGKPEAIDVPPPPADGAGQAAEKNRKAAVETARALLVVHCS